MTHNRYEPPKSGFNSLPREPGSIVKAVLTGLATDIGGTTLAGIVFSLIYGIVLSTQGMSVEEVQKFLEHTDPLSAFSVFSTIVGLGFSVFGGFVCARVANRPGYLAIGIQSAISVAFGAAMGPEDYSWQLLLGLNLLSLAGTFTGGWLYIRKLAPQP